MTPEEYYPLGDPKLEEAARNLAKKTKNMFKDIKDDFLLLEQARITVLKHRAFYEGIF